MGFQGLRYACRSLWHSRGFSTVAVVCLSLGLALNTTIFSIVDGVLLQPYPYTDPDRILVLGAENQRTTSRSGLSFLDMRDWRAASAGFSVIAGTQARALSVSDGTGE